VFRAASHAGNLEVTLGNASARPIKVLTEVNTGAALRSVDPLTVTLRDAAGQVRTITFVGDRKESEPILTPLAPGGSTVVSIDLAAWAVAGGGAPLAPGRYAATLRWDDSHAPAAWQVAPVVATAVTTVEIPAPIATACEAASYRAPAQAQLTLLTRQRPGSRATLDVGLHNRGPAVCVWSYVDVGDPQSDWLSVEVGGQTLRFVTARTESRPVSVTLPPGATAWTTWDLEAWARRQRDVGPGRLPTGSLEAHVRYDAHASTTTWAGVLTANAWLTIP
jgi:hypothetical protein